MLFNSLHFLVFFPFVTLVYFVLPHKFRWLLLLLASYYFYMSWKLEYVVLLAVTTLTVYLCALAIQKTLSKKKKKFYLSLSLVVTLGIIFGFKYFNFFNDSLRAILDQFTLNLDIPYLRLLLPIGISFYTFQALSYVIDVYQGKIKAERHLGIFALYISFFPQLVAGPIERASNLLPQFFKKQEFDYKRVTDGMKVMLWGFFLKMVVADRLAMFVDLIYNSPTDYTGWPLIIATYFFGFQIYCDFAGYSFIAIGAAQVLGFDLMDNFKRPYFSKSIQEFWRRWHISLSTWFRDYIYIPLGGSQVKKSKVLRNVIIVFFVSGLWHGAGLTFIIWGLLHGAYLIIGSLTKGIREKALGFMGAIKHSRIHKFIQLLVTFHLVTFAWIFFRSNTISDAFYVINNLFVKSNLSFDEVFTLSQSREFIVAIVAILFMEFIHLIQERVRIRQFLDDKPIILRWILYYIIIFAILIFGVFEKVPFIYFQF